MSTITLVFLIMASQVLGSSAWSITQMQSMTVCQQVLVDVRSHGGLNHEFTSAPVGLTANSL